MSPFIAGVIGLSLVALAACASARDDAVKAINASSDFGAQAEHALEALDKHDQEEAVSHAWSEAQAKAAVAAVRTKYAPAWKAYRDYRSAITAAQFAAAAYDASQSKDGAQLQLAVQRALEAETAFIQATQDIREAPKDGGL